MSLNFIINDQGAKVVTKSSLSHRVPNAAGLPKIHTGFRRHLLPSDSVAIILMEKDNSKDQDTLGPLHDAAQQEPALPPENWSDDEAFVPVFGGYTGKGEGDDNYQSSNDPAQHIGISAQRIDNPVERSGDQDQGRYDYTQHSDNHTRDDYDTQSNTSTRRSDSVQEYGHTKGGSHAPGDGSGIGRIDDVDKV